MIADEILQLTPERLSALIVAQDSAGAPTKERRHASRWPLGGVVEFWPKGTWSGASFYGTCRDISEAALGLSCNRAVEPGALIELALHAHDMALHGYGIVRHCTQAEAGYLIGIEFEFA